MTPVTFAPGAFRARFPALDEPGPGGLPRVRVDAPAGTQVPTDVADAVAAGLLRTANSHMPSPVSHEMDALMVRSRERAARLVGGDPGGQVLGANMTTLTWHLSHALDERVGEGDEIVCTRLDHDANVAPWLALAARRGATVRWVPITDRGALDIAAGADFIGERTALVTLPLASNLLGTVTDPSPLVARAHAHDALVIADAVHAAPHVALDQSALGVDVLLWSPYKVYGPHLGVMSASPTLLAELRPEKVRPSPDSGPDRWQTGTAPFELAAGLDAALGVVEEAGGVGALAEHEARLAQRFLDGLEALAGHVRLHGPSGAEGRTPTFALTSTHGAPEELAERLAVVGIDATAGDVYAVEPCRALGLDDGVLRVGFAAYHDERDVDRVLAGLAEVA